MSGSAIEQIIPSDGGDHGVLQSEGFDDPSYTGWFIFVHRRWRSGRNGAEAAVAGANIPQDHEGGCALPPALAQVGAAGFTANRIQAVIPDQPVEVYEGFSLGEAGFQPVGFSMDFDHRRGAEKRYIIQNLKAGNKSSSEENPSCRS